MTTEITEHIIALDGIDVVIKLQQGTYGETLSYKLGSPYALMVKNWKDSGKSWLKIHYATINLLYVGKHDYL